MGFLGGLAGTLNKVIGQQAAIERDEASTIRKEDRAALAKFNAENNEQVIDGVPSYVLTGKNGVIASRPIPQHVLDKRKADGITSKDIINRDDLFQKSVASGYTGDKSQWELDNKNAGEAKHLEVTEAIKNKFSLASFTAQQAILQKNQREMAYLTSSLSNAKTPEETAKINAEVRKLTAEATWMEEFLKNPGKVPNPNATTAVR